MSVRERLRGLPGGTGRRGARRGAELVPQARLSGPMPWVVAIMVALTVIAAAAALSLRHAAHAARVELSGGITVQVVEGDAARREAQAGAVVRRLREVPGVMSVRRVPAGEVDALLEPWLGGATGLDGDSLPVPALIDARLDGAATPARIAALREGLRPVAPAARVDAQATWLAPVFDALVSLQWLAVALIALLAGAMAAAVLLAARTALGQHRPTIEIVHLLGATDTQLARLFQRSIGLDALLGGLAGLGLAVIAILQLGSRFADLGAGLVSGGALGAVDWAVLALIPVAGAVLAMVTARLSIRRALRQMV